MQKRELNGTEIADFVKERQKTQVRSMGHAPTLVIVRTNDDPVTDVYLRIKQRYAEQIGVKIELVSTSDGEAPTIIKSLNDRDDVDGIIVQLPLKDSTKTDDVLNSVVPVKDVDGLGRDATLDPATPTAILWLLAAYNIDMSSKRTLVIGQGRLVGAPLSEMLASSGVDVSVADEHTGNLKDLCLESQIIISAAGKPNLVTSDMVPADCIIVDAGTSTDNGEVVGDVSEDVRSRTDVTITPKKGGVGPLTVAALFDNLLRVTK
jgi:methylenetetrahydrofolate dehydrogenase (NADP+) / methenyltetrahydrofolate cyclohydrolase